MINKIKIGKKEYEVQKGDYILNNGSCWQFVAGDRRVLAFLRGRERPTSFRLNPKDLALIDLSTLKMVDNSTEGMTLIFYFF